MGIPLTAPTSIATAVLAVLLIAHLVSATEQLAAGVAVLFTAVASALTTTTDGPYLKVFSLSETAGVSRPTRLAPTRMFSAPRC